LVHGRSFYGKRFTGESEKEEEPYLFHGVANHGCSKNPKNQAFDLAPSQVGLGRCEWVHEKRDRAEI
jgi:hypothetical protein